MMFQRIIGLTGGIGSGKTTVSNYLADKYNLMVLDADIYAREAVDIDSPILAAIFTRYGDRLMLENGRLNRTALAEIIFNNPLEKQWLESQIHPYVRHRFQQELLNLKDNTVVLAIPLLFEANFTDLVTEIWVVYCDRSTQVTRLQQRDRLTIQQAETRIDNQLPLSEKIKLADVVLDNSGNLQHLTQQIDRAIAINRQDSIL
ncbi:MAG: dephospho-CoA kinase [Pleurocapsa sp.]